MYADYFGFRELPFNNTPDPRFFFSTPDHEEALASLIYAVKERKGFVLLTGEVGAGKTLVTRLMVRHFDTQIAFANINHAIGGPGDLLEAICTEFELPFRAGSTINQLVRTLHDYLLAQFAQNVPVVLVLDEAQNFPVDAFEQLRMIGNLEADDAKLLQIAIVGQPELQRLFLSPELRQLRQRIFRSFHLPALNRKDSEAYIRHRLTVASGQDSEVFGDDAIEVIYKHSRGLPRIINTVCDNALLSAYSADRRTIDAQFVESVIAQMMLIGRTASPEDGPAFPQVRPRMTCAASPSSDLPEHLIQSITEMTRRLGNIESQLRDRPATPQVAGPTHDLQDHDEAIRSLRDEFNSLQESVAASLEERDRPIEATEQGQMLADENAESAHRIQALLKEDTARAQDVVERVNASVLDVQRRHEQLRKLSGTVGVVVKDLRRLLDHAAKVVARTGYAERRARATHEQLATQSKHARAIADELRLRTPAANAALRSISPAAESEESGLLGPVKIALAERILPGRQDGGVPSVLGDARESLSGLRHLARDGGSTGSGDDDGVANLPTTRLANEVENLLDLIGTGRCPNTDDQSMGVSPASARQD